MSIMQEDGQGEQQPKVLRLDCEADLLLSLPSSVRPLAENPFHFWGKTIDCGDIPVTRYGFL